MSIGTVSKALNGSGSLSDDTRKRVMETGRALHFRPNMLARSLHTGLSGSVGLISNDSFGRFTMPIMEGLEGVLSGSGIGVFMVNATDDAEREKAHLDQLLAKQIDGLIVTARRADRRPSVDLRGLGLPVIYVFSQGDTPGALTLLPDDKGGARLATDHLVQRGRRHHPTPERPTARRHRLRQRPDRLRLRRCPAGGGGELPRRHRPHRLRQLDRDGRGIAPPSPRST